MSDSHKTDFTTGQKPDQKQYKTNLQYHRNQKGLSQDALAESSGISLRTLQEYEQGRRDINKAMVKTVVAFADTLDVDIRDIMEPEKPGE